ncbi:MAG TPA: T9SS type A sorting domain-containing protein, partial [Flavobacteriales bacterium]|nr:T9SS type A sorting domain-containing protein [Flavobacteriales bacterium]
IRVADHSGPATVELIGMDGRVAFQQNVVLNSTSASPIDLSGAALANGAYVLRVATSEGTAAQRIIKMD